MNPRTIRAKKKWLGQRKLNKDNEWMEIVDFRNSRDIDVLFGDGNLIKHRRCDQFKSGSIKNPNLYSKRLGERKQNNQGDWMEIIAYRGSEDIDVKFDLGGSILEHKKYLYFERGCFRNPLHYLKRIGKTNLNYQGLKMTLIEWNDLTDVTIRFDDGTEIDHQDYRKFKSGYIRHPNYAISTKVSRNEYALLYYLESFGFKHYECGELKEYGIEQYSADLFNAELMLAIEYDGFHHKYRDDHRKNKEFASNGINLIRIREPELEQLNDGLSINFNLLNGYALNSTLTSTFCEIVDYINKNYPINIDVDINIERDKEDIIEQYLNHTDYRTRDKHIGTKVQNNQGLWLTIIDYRSCNDIDLKFDLDGTIIKHKNHIQISRGILPHPTIKRLKTNRMGEIRKNNSGFEMKIISYRSVVDIDVMFTDDNSIVKNRQYSDFKRGNIKHP